MLLSLCALTKGYNTKAPNIYAGFCKDEVKNITSKGYLSGTEAFFSLIQNIKDSDVIFINFNKGSGLFVFDAYQDRLILSKYFLKDYEIDKTPKRNDSLIGPEAIPPFGLKPSKNFFNVPFISSLDPDKTNFSEKINVSIIGNNLSNVTEVIFGEDSIEFVVIDDGRINFYVPALEKEGEYSVYAKNAFVISNKKIFQFQKIKPVIDSIKPNKGALNESVPITVTGKNFYTVTNAVFAGKSILPTEVSETTLTITPKKRSKLGTVQLYLESPEGRSNKIQYEYIPPEIIRSITPNFGSLEGGEEFVIELENFKQALELKFGDRDIAAKIKENGVIFGKVPKGKNSDPVKISVRNVSGFSNSVTFYYFDGLPSINGISPNLLHVEESGVTITITGKNFTPNNVVNVNNIEISPVNFINNTTLTFIAPKSDKTQDVDVYVNRPGDGNSNKVKLFYKSKILPEISKIEPREGKIEGGDKIKIKGEHLSKTNKVTFNGVAGKIENNKNDNLVEVITPAADHEGECEVILYTYEGQATCPKDTFTYVNDVPVPPS